MLRLTSSPSLHRLLIWLRFVRWSYWNHPKWFLDSLHSSFEFFFICSRRNCTITDRNHIDCSIFSSVHTWWRMKIELDQLNTTQSPLILEEIEMKMSPIRRHEAVRTIRFFHNQRQAQAMADLIIPILAGNLIAWLCRFRSNLPLAKNFITTINVILLSLRLQNFVANKESKSPGTSSSSWAETMFLVVCWCMTFRMSFSFRIRDHSSRTFFLRLEHHWRFSSRSSLIQRTHQDDEDYAWNSKLRILSLVALSVSVRPLTCALVPSLDNDLDQRCVDSFVDSFAPSLQQWLNIELLLSTWSTLPSDRTRDVYFIETNCLDQVLLNMYVNGAVFSNKSFFK